MHLADLLFPFYTVNIVTSSIYILGRCPVPLSISQHTLTNSIFDILNYEAYCVVAVESVGRQVPMAFLERVKDDFTKKYGGGKAATAVANSLSKEFGYIL